MVLEPKTTDYCGECGESPDSGNHLFGKCNYTDPRTLVLDHAGQLANDATYQSLTGADLARIFGGVESPAAKPGYNIEEHLAWLEANTIQFEFAWEKVLKEKQVLLDRITELEERIYELQSVSNGHVGSKRRSRGSRSNPKKRSTARGKGKARKGSK